MGCISAPGFNGFSLFPYFKCDLRSLVEILAAKIVATFLQIQSQSLELLSLCGLLLCWLKGIEALTASICMQIEKRISLSLSQDTTFSASLCLSVSVAVFLSVSLSSSFPPLSH